MWDLIPTRFLKRQAHSYSQWELYETLLATRAGLEPTTAWLTARRSTN